VISIDTKQEALIIAPIWGFQAVGVAGKAAAAASKIDENKRLSPKVKLSQTPKLYDFRSDFSLYILKFSIYFFDFFTFNYLCESRFVVSPNLTKVKQLLLLGLQP
jgi:hypothetical protein